MRSGCCSSNYEGGLTLIAFIDITIAIVTVSATAVLFSIPGLYNTIQEIFNDNSMQMQELNYTVWGILVAMLVVTCLIYMAVEVVLFISIKEAANNRVYTLAHRWFWIRLTVLMISCGFTIYRIATLTYSPYDAVFEPVKFYRIIQLVFVQNFMTEVKRSSLTLSKSDIKDIINSIYVPGTIRSTKSMTMSSSPSPDMELPGHYLPHQLYSSDKC